MKIAVDAMGGDFAPRAIVEGAVLASKKFGMKVVLVGDEDQVGKELSKHPTSKLSYLHPPRTARRRHARFAFRGDS